MAIAIASRLLGQCVYADFGLYSLILAAFPF